MYPDQFEYYSPDTVDEALDLLDDHGSQETELLAGGQSLIPTMKSGLASPDVLIDLGGIEALDGVESGDQETRIGGLTRYSTLVDSADLRRTAPVVVAAAEEIADMQVRNRGTIGGNLAHADPAADLPAAFLAAEGSVIARGPDGERRIDGEDFFHGMYVTALDADEILTEVVLPHHRDDVAAYRKKPSPSSGFAMVGVAARLTTTEGGIESASIAANGAMDHAIRLDAVEAAVQDEPATEQTVVSAAKRATDGVDVSLMMDDVQASNEYRAQLLEVFTERALRDAVDVSGPAQTASD
jgi:carbon-monoxide dehydrogenase medium subunit